MTDEVYEYQQSMQEQAKAAHRTPISPTRTACETENHKKQQLVDEYAREHLCATCEWKNDNICTLPRCMKMEERSKNERKTAQPR